MKKVTDKSKDNTKVYVIVGIAIIIIVACLPGITKELNQLMELCRIIK